MLVQKSMVLSPQGSPRAHISTAFTTRMLFCIFVKKSSSDTPAGQGPGGGMGSLNLMGKSANPINILIGFPVFLTLSPHHYPPSRRECVGRTIFFTKIKSIILVVNTVEIWALGDLWGLRTINLHACAKFCVFCELIVAQAMYLGSISWISCVAVVCKI